MRAFVVTDAEEDDTMANGNDTGHDTDTSDAPSNVHCWGEDLHNLSKYRIGQKYFPITKYNYRVMRTINISLHLLIL